VRGDWADGSRGVTAPVELSFGEQTAAESDSHRSPNRRHGGAIGEWENYIEASGQLGCALGASPCWL
jgi:hypothetical protein